MITRKEALKLASSSAFTLAASRATAAMAGAGPLTSDAAGAAPAIPADMRRLTTADLRALPKLQPATQIRRTGRTRAFTLVLARAAVEPLPGHSVQTTTVNGSSPGPVLRMTEGDAIEITVVNRLSRGTSIHWHGIPTPFAMDGAALFSQRPIAPHTQFVYRWVAPQAGTYMYHSHYDEMQEEGIFGMIVVDAQDPKREPHYDVDVPIAVSSIDWEPARRSEAAAVLADSMLMQTMTDPKADPNPGMGDAMERMDMVEYWCFNGKTFPATAPIRVKEGDLVRVRFANVTHMSHPMHLHGHWFRWIAQDGAPLPDPRPMNTLPVDPGRTVDIDFIANNPGVWPLHCHIVSHMVDNKDVMSGLVTAVVYEGFSLPAMMKASQA